MIYAIITRNPLNTVTTPMYAIIPAVICLMSLIVCFAARVKNETTHQLVWLLAFSVEAALLTANQIAWRWSFSSELHEALLPFQHEDPTALFSLTEMGWYHTMGLIFVSVLVRPRFPYLLAYTFTSFVAYATGAILLRHQILLNSILVRMIVFVFCCTFNLFAGWALEVGERKVYIVTHGLKRRLEIEKHKLRLESEAKSKAERVLVSYLCHEIRNPFNGVLGFAELIVSALAKIKTTSITDVGKSKGTGIDASIWQDTTPCQVDENHHSVVAKSISQVTDWCNIIVVNSKHIRDILDNVLDLSKLEAGTLELVHAPVKVMELCSKIHLLLRSTAKEDVTFIVDVEPKGLVIMGDTQRWKQLLVNLVSNALKFTHAGRVILRIKQINEKNGAHGVSVEVCDTGVGISAQEQTMLFQKYQQIHSSETDTKGTGLGLVIAQRISSLLKTNIEIESPWRKKRGGDGEGGGEWVEGGDGGGGGTRFFFSVDSCVADGSGTNVSVAAGPPSPSSSSARMGLRRVDGGVHEGATLRHELKILVVDDDMMNRMIMSMKLTNSDEFNQIEIVVEQASNEVDVEELMSEHNTQYFDVIIMDEHLGEESAKGSVITRRLRDKVRERTSE
jgi:signal transduction histidine kinase